MTHTNSAGVCILTLCLWRKSGLRECTTVPRKKMSEKNKTSDQLKRVEAHFADLRLRVQKFKAKLERVNIDNGGRVLTVDQVTMLHDAYGFSWSLYAHTLS